MCLIGSGPAQPIFAELASVEDRHFWFLARNELIRATIAGLVRRLRPDCRVLEVGCGTGNVLRFLRELAPQGVVVGFDLYKAGLEFARQRTDCLLVQGDAGAPPFRRDFDIVGAFDVLEHIPEDLLFLNHIRRMLSPDGFLVLTVPAHPYLWSYFDEASGHCRRYELTELQEKLASSGFEISYHTPFMATLVPLMWLGRRLAGLRRKAKNSQASLDLARNELRVRPVVNEALKLLLSMENRWIAAGRPLPFGTSLLVIAKPSRHGASLHSAWPSAC